MKAEKAGETTVDLAAAKGGSSSTPGGKDDSDGTGNDGSGDTDLMG